MVRYDAELDAIPSGRALIRVRDPLESYWTLAAWENRRRDWRVAAVTGSVGKTTTKDVLAALLAPHLVTGFSEGTRCLDNLILDVREPLWWTDIVTRVDAAAQSWVYDHNLWFDPDGGQTRFRFDDLSRSFAEWQATQFALPKNRWKPASALASSKSPGAGLVTLRMLADTAGLPPGRIVLLGSPLRGSGVAHDLRKAEARAHILEGLKIALENLDDVVGLIRAASSPASVYSQSSPLKYCPESLTPRRLLMRWEVLNAPWNTERSPPPSVTVVPSDSGSSGDLVRMCRTPLAVFGP